MSQDERDLMAHFDDLVEMRATEQEAYLSALPPSLQEQLRELLAADEGFEEWADEQDDGVADSEDPYLGHVIEGKYTIERLISHGGMGSVYLATQSDPVERQVAIKFIRASHEASEEATDKFVKEMQLLVELKEHPNIVKVVSAGRTQGNGIPYLVMNYIDGALPITEYCDRRRLSIKSRLELMLDVISAVQFCHNRDVVHCDLKPGNILVSSDGRVHLLDFGIATTIREERERAARLANASSPHEKVWYSPGYASPEQVAGQAIRKAADIYSLGVILHQLLIGAKPAPLEPTKETGSRKPSQQWVTLPPEERVKAATARQSTPNVLRRRLAGELDAIMTTALMQDQRKRFGSALSLEEDIRNHLAHRPVSVYDGGLLYLLGKMAKRRPIATIAGAIAFLTLSVLSFNYVKSAQLAHKRLQTSRAVAERIVNELDQRLSYLPGAKSVRDELIDQALNLQNELLADANDYETIRLRTQTALLRARLAADYENGAAAREHLENALAHHNTLAAFNRASQQEQLLKGRIRVLQSGLARAEGEYQHAAEYSEEARQIGEQLVADDSSPETIRFRNSALWELGVIAKDQDRYDDAEDYYVAGIESCRQLVESNPDDEANKQDLSTHLHLLAELYRYREENELAREVFEEALKVSEGLVRNNPVNELNLRELMKNLGGLAEVNVLLRHRDVASVLRDRAVAITEKLTLFDPTSKVFKRDLAINLKEAGRLADGEEARQKLVKSNRIYREFHKAEPSDIQYQRDLANSYAHLAIHDKREKQYSDALDWLKQAEIVTNKILDSGKANDGDLRHRAILLRERCDVLTAVERYDEARASLNECLEVRGELANKHPANNKYRRDKITTYYSLGQLALATNDLDGAIRWNSMGIDGIKQATEEGLVLQRAELDIVEFEKMLARAKQRKFAIGPLDTIFSDPNNDVASLLSERIIYFNKQSDAEAVEEAARLLKRRFDGQSKELFNSACGLALSLRIRQKKEKDEVKLEALKTEAFKRLNEALDAGFKDLRLLKRDSDLDSLRSDPRFDEVVNRLANPT